MTYKLNRTDGSLLAEVIDSSLDQTTTDITLIGKNASNFGTYLNENFIHLLENFANTSQPNRPLTGQLWFDTNELRLKVYTGQQWKQTSGPVVSGTAPLISSLTQGDFWIDSLENQLWFYDGEEGLKLAGPIYKQSQGISGFETRTIFDSNNIERVVLVLWLAGSVLGIFSSAAIDFTIPTSEFSAGVVNNPIKPGFNVCNIPVGGQTALKFNVTSTKADGVLKTDGTVVTGDQVLRSDVEAQAQGPLKILNDNPMYLGSSEQVRLAVNAAGFCILSNAMPNARLGVFTQNPQYSLDVAGSFRVTQKLKLPTFTTAQRDARGSPENGEIIYNTTTNRVQAYASGIWVDLH